MLLLSPHLLQFIQTFLHFLFTLITVVAPLSSCFDAGLPRRRTLLWSGKWANCPECIIIQEVEPPLKETDSEDSLNRYLLYSKCSENITRHRLSLQYQDTCIYYSCKNGSSHHIQGCMGYILLRTQLHRAFVIMCYSDIGRAHSVFSQQ